MAIVDEIKRHWRIISIAICAVLMFSLAGRWGPVSLPKSYLLFGLAILILLFGTSYWNELRYKTRPLVCPNMKHASVKDYWIIGDWAIIPIGSVDADGFSWIGGQGTVIVPKTSVIRHPTYVEVHSKPAVRDFAELPHMVRKAIETLPGCGPPYFFCPVNYRPSRIDEVYKSIRDEILKAIPELKNHNPDFDGALKQALTAIDAKLSEEIKRIESHYKKEYETQEAKITEQNRIIKLLEELLADKYKGITDFADAAGTVQRALRKKGFFELIKSAGEEKKEVPE
jgi:hypothetical protein